MIKKYYESKSYLTWLLVLILFVISSNFSSVSAQDKIIQEVTFQPDEIKAAVETWVRKWTPQAQPDAVVELLEPYYEDNQVYAYIAHLSGGGYCFCGTNNLVLPVYIYSPQGTYNPQEPGCVYMLKEIVARTKYLQNALAWNDPDLDAYRDELKTRSSDWADLVEGRTPVDRVSYDQTPYPIKVQLKLDCKWHQGSPYNDACPALSPVSDGWDEHAVVGCNQTAMAQMMYYWQWPRRGEDEHTHSYDIHWLPVGFWISESLTTDPQIPPNWPVGHIGEAQYERMRWNSGAQVLQINGYWDSSIYWHAANKLGSDPDYLAALDNLYNRLPVDTDQWTIDLDVETYDWSIIPAVGSDPPDAGAAEAAKLCFHIGITTNAGWGIGGTTGKHEVQAQALKNHFRYHDDAMQQDCDPNDMVEELQWLRPVGMGGDLAGGGRHAGVILGYDASFPNWQFLMNMGGGGSDVWRSLDNTPGGYHFNQSNLIRVAPLNVFFVGNTHPGDGSPDNPCQNVEEALTLAPDEATLIFKAGSVNTFDAGTLVINRPLKIKGYNAIIQ